MILLPRPIFQDFFRDDCNLDCKFLAKLRVSKKFNLIELGAGNGEMMKILLESFKNFSVFFNSCNFIIHEKSPSLIKIQKKNYIKVKSFGFQKSKNK